MQKLWIMRRADSPKVFEMQTAAKTANPNSELKNAEHRVRLESIGLLPRCRILKDRVCGIPEETNNG